MMKITRRKAIWTAVIAALGVAGPGIGSGGGAAAAVVAQDLDTIATANIKDLTATLLVSSDETNFAELKKIGGSFATTYRFKRMNVSYKNPNKARFEAKVAGANVVVVFNGDTKLIRIPLKTHKSNVADQPGQKQSLMDLGIFARDYLTTDYKPVFLRKDGGLMIYKLVQRNTDNKSHEVVWVNPKTFITERRQSFNGDNKLQKEIRYKNARVIRPGIWVPLRIEVYNQFGKLGAVQSVEDVKVNLGVSDSQFATT